MKYQFIEGYDYFITYKLIRNNNFVFNEKIKEIILKKLIENQENVEVEIFSILNNHLHFILKSAQQNLMKKYLGKLAGGSSYTINKYLDKRGKFWDKYFAVPILDERAYFNIAGYILGNPIRHSVVRNFDELLNYKFCNFKQICNDWGREFTENVVLRVLKIKDEKLEKEFWDGMD